MTRRYEKEIMELLERKEREHRGKERIHRVRRNVHEVRQRAAPGGVWARLGGIRWTVASLALAILAFVLHNTIPSVTNVMILVAVGLFFVPVFVRPAHTLHADDPMWRGQRVEPTPFPVRRQGPWEQLRRFFRDGRRPPRD